MPLQLVLEAGGAAGKEVYVFLGRLGRAKLELALAGGAHMKEKNSKTRIKMGQGQQCSTATPKTDQLHTVL